MRCLFGISKFQLFSVKADVVFRDHGILPYAQCRSSLLIACQSLGYELIHTDVTSAQGVSHSCDITDDVTIGCDVIDDASMAMLSRVKFPIGKLIRGHVV